MSMPMALADKPGRKMLSVGEGGGGGGRSQEAPPSTLASRAP